MKRKMFIKTILLNSTFILLCSTAEARFNIRGFEKYYNDWITLGGPKTTNLVIRFGKMTLKPAARNLMLIAECDEINGVPTITVYKLYWDKAELGDRVITIFHEMGHCVLGRDHDDTLRPDGTPNSIMASIHFDYRIVGKDPEHYLKELFKNLSNQPISK